MSINQVNDQFNDAFEVYFPNANPLIRWPNAASARLLSFSLNARKWIFGGQLIVNERIVEYPQITRWLQPTGTVLDIGCVSSRLPIQLASLGYTVHGVDVRSYSFTHPNFTFHREDLFQWHPPQQFDIILLISTLEHFGIGGYGDLQVEEADIKAIDQISQWLVPGGQILVSLPFGKAGITTKHRIYDSPRLSRLFAEFEWRNQAYFQRLNGAWLPSSAEALSQVESPALPPNGVAILDLRSRPSS